MPGTRMLTDHDEIRAWAAARIGSPAIIDASPEAGLQAVLTLVFDQAAFQDQDGAEHDTYDIVEWDDWFQVFDDRRLGLIVSEERPGVIDSWHQLAVRDDDTDEATPEVEDWDRDDPEVRYLAENTDLSPLQASKLVARHGHDRERLMELARTMKAES